MGRYNDPDVRYQPTPLATHPSIQAHPSSHRTLGTPSTPTIHHVTYVHTQSVSPRLSRSSSLSPYPHPHHAALPLSHSDSSSGCSSRFLDSGEDHRRTFTERIQT
ncbi:hypothetical protein IE53DRAFT_390562 [Violaceomyces palustris]|uniref:Uncharacterized protein n=1 Tax=Violaceomyces palustris TaxID=1673888 RepID=A0ACD0NND1_9BASI|nr:hypothetical protein IE53DRAFT_390562 [Violaceomyces palustris]